LIDSTVGAESGVPDSKGAVADDLHIKIGEKVDISASKGIVDALVRCEEYTLYWYGQHPWQGASILVFLLLALLILSWTRRERLAMKQEYRDKIEASKVPQLPLPPPDPK
jgi:hypothetical protein